MMRTFVILSGWILPLQEAFVLHPKVAADCTRTSVGFLKNKPCRSHNPRSCLLAQKDGDKHKQNADEDDRYSNYPAPTVWTYNPSSEEWVRQDGRPKQSLPLVARQTWAWCRDFVLPLQLCPWAKASMDTPQALQIFVVEDVLDGYEDVFTRMVEDVGLRLQEFLATSSTAMQSAAIYFVVFANADYPNHLVDMNDFPDYYDWFLDLEDSWEWTDSVIVAPFHPDWAFEGEREALQFEKRSPYPTITMVSAKVVDAAGEAVTAQIGEHNKQVLLSRSAEELQHMWKQCLLSRKGG